MKNAKRRGSKIATVFLIATLMLGLAAPGAVPVPAAFAASAVAADDSGDVLAETFDAMTLGQKPAGWTGNPPAAAVPDASYIAKASVEELDGHGSRLLKLEKNAKSTATYNLERAVSGATSRSELTYKVRAEQTGAVVYLPSPKNGTSSIKFALNGGQFAYMKQGASSWTNLMPYDSGVWYEVRLVHDAEAGRFDLFINGQQLLFREPFQAGGQLTAFYLGMYKDSAGVVYFDDFYVRAYKPAIAITPAKAVYQLTKGVSETINLAFQPADATFRTVDWSSSDPAVAEVSRTGVVTAKAVGTALITAQSYDPLPPVTVTVKVTEAGQSGGDVLSESFDTMTLGQRPSTWTGNPPPAAPSASLPYIAKASVEEIAAYPGRVFKIEKNGMSASTYTLDRKVPATTSKFQLTYKVRAEQTNAVIYLPSPKIGAAAVKFAMNGGQFAYTKKDAEGWTNIAPYESGEWYEIKLVQDGDEGVFDFYIDNALKLTREPSLEGAGPSSFYLGMYKDSAGIVYFDDFNLYSYTPAAGAALEQASYNLAKGARFQIPLVFDPVNATIQSASWTSARPDIASVTNSGVVSGLQTGSAVITVQPYALENPLEVTVHVYEVPLTGISLEPLAAPVPTGSRVLLKGAAIPANTTSPELTWTTEHPEIATVDRYGELTAAALGTTKVYVSGAEGTIRNEISVTVVPRGVAQTLYVSPSGSDLNPGTEQLPLGTLAGAQRLVRQMNGSMTGDIVVRLRGGVYTLSEPLRFDESDSGSNGYFVRYESYPGEQAVLSGGRKITGWTEHDSERGIYKAQVGLNFATRQLFVDGVRATRARSEGGLTRAIKTTNGYTSDDTFLAGWSKPDDLEFVFHELWTNPRAGVESVTLANGKAEIKLENPGWYAVANKGMTSATVPVYYENAYELLDQPGEWYYNSTDGYLYYKPRAWERLETAEVTAPVLERLMEIKGASPDRPVRNLQFEGLGFRYTTWMRPSTSVGHADAQNNYLRYPGSPDELADGAIMLELANTINFKRNDFSKLGITGIVMNNGVQNSQIEGNKFYDISGGAINIGQPFSGVRDNFNPADHRKTLKNNNIVNNYIHDIGVDYKSAAAISGGFPLDMEISHNEIYNIPYSGTHFGYGWAKDFDPVMKNIRIKHNMIYDLMGMGLRDGGAIYSLGVSGATAADKNLVYGNYIRNQMDDSAALYADEGSAYWRYERNVIDLRESGPWHSKMRWAQAWAVTIHDQDFIDNYTTEAYYVNNGFDNRFEGTKVVPDGNWPEEARNIIAASGLEPAYADLAAGQVSRWSAEPVQLNVGGSAAVKVTARDGKDRIVGTEGSRIYYASNNPEIAAVDSQGQVTGLQTGQTKVVISIVNGTMLRTLEADVFVGDTLSDIRLEQTTGQIVFAEAGKRQQLHAFGSTSFGNKIELDSVTFDSLNPQVATVSPDGLLTAHQAGSAVLRLRGSFLGQERDGYYHLKVWSGSSTGTHPLIDEVADTDSWYVYPSAVNNVQTGADSITITTPNSGHAVYQGRQYVNELLDFKLTINATSSWYALLFGKRSDTLGYSNDSNYLVVVSESGLELQRYNDGKRTVIYGTIAGHTSLAGPAIPNTMLPFNAERRIQLGTYNEAGGVRIILKVDGEEIINYLDTADDALRGPGYFGLVARSGSLTFAKPTPEPMPIIGLAADGPEMIAPGESGATVVRAVYDNGKHAVLAEGISYTSSDPSVVSVDAFGIVKAHRPGMAYITASYEGHEASFRVTVGGTAGIVWPEDAFAVAQPFGPNSMRLSWTSAGGDAVKGYTVYMKTVSDDVYAEVVSAPAGSFTVTEGVYRLYSYETGGLRHETVYDFKIEALNGDGAASTNGPSARAATLPGEGPSDTEKPVWPPGAALSAPLTGIRTDSVMLGWPSAADTSGIAGYEVFQGPALIRTVAADVYGYQATGLTADTVYAFKVTALDAAGNRSEALETQVRTARAAWPEDPEEPDNNSGGDSGENVGSPSGSGPGTALPLAEPQEPAITEQGVLLNGDALHIVSGTNSDGKPIERVEVSVAALKQAFAALAGQPDAARQLIVAAPAPGGGKGVQVELSASAWAEGLSRVPGAVVVVRAGSAAYHLPAGLADIPQWAGQLGAAARDLQLVVAVERVEGPAASGAARQLADLDAAPVSDMVEFKLLAQAGERTMEINDFNVYVERSLSLTKRVDPAQAAGMTVDADGNLSFVPTIIREEQGTQVAWLKRRGNSIYMVAERSQSFADLGGHWAKADVELLASKLIVRGRSADRFAPDQPVTRAEFTALLVRSLGLQDAPAASTYKDVTSEAWYAGAVGAAARAGLAEGMDDGRFRPDEPITREQLAVMLLRAAEAAGGLPQRSPLSAQAHATVFTDGASVSTWAADGVEQAVRAGLLQGVANGSFAPAEQATRAQSAAALRRLLQAVQFIN
ncbi:Ig-like domain (group 2) [Paenibacillus sp. UNCCL117]|uniref:Ig-like domain-containing protein n=1 Tax=unclassified Paenibacillus TaxID=185978 RepID=UPI0008875A00|nr:MULTISPECIES: Ig-like domain-containing protein [unclassified Paenibacillus]SDC07749.1 Ig-like domain (group 2) [Paenibacillus sp. cl123]SFW38119.1 Ig-like domain (group 2) [Paenibacillus sp. UNCCL117]